MKRIRLFLILVFFIFTPSCAHHSSFVKKNLKSFHEFTLQNGIPVIVKTSDHSRLRSVVLTLRGGKGLIPRDKAGLDAVTLKLMNMESKKYPEVTRRTILKKCSASMGVSDDIDYATFAFKTIDTYFDQIFDLYADLFLNPVMSEKYFDEIITNMKNSYRASMTDGYARVSNALNNDFFRDHPYAAYLHTTETLDNITLEDVRSFYKKNYVASRIVIFAAGNFDLDGLKNRLERTFGKIQTGAPFDTPEKAFHVIKNPPLILDAYENLSPDASYVRGNFPSVPITHPDYWAVTLAANILSDILTNIIRTKNSMVYSVWANPYGKKSSYASISAYRTSDPVKIIDLIGQSIDMAASGKCLSPYKGGESTNGFVPISEGLAFYKASSSTKYFSGLRTNRAIAGKMAASFMLTGDVTAYLKTMDQINAVTAEEVKTAILKYFKKNEILWAVSAHPDVIETLKKNHRSYAPEYKMAKLNME